MRAGVRDGIPRKGKMMENRRFKLGQHVRAKQDFPVHRIGPHGTQKIADVKFKDEAIVTGYSKDKPILNIVKYQIIVTLEEEFWEAVEERRNDKYDGAKDRVG